MTEQLLRELKTWEIKTLCILAEMHEIPLYWEDVRETRISEFELDRLVNRGLLSFTFSGGLVFTDQGQAFIDWFNHERNN